MLPTRPPPQRFAFTPDLHRRYAGRDWRCPLRLVHGGALAHLWAAGHHAATSVLPVLAVHVLPDVHRGRGAAWTPRKHLSHRRIAALAGLTSVGSVGKALAALEDAKLVRRFRPPRGSTVAEAVQVAATVHAHGDDEHLRVPASWFYGGLWPMLPTPAARLLFLALACADGVRHERVFLASYHGDDPDGALRAERARHGVAAGELGAWTGLGADALGTARTALTMRAPGGPFRGQALVASGPAARLTDGRPRAWYTLNRAAASAVWPFDTLNGDADGINVARASAWARSERATHMQAVADAAPGLAEQTTQGLAEQTPPGLSERCSSAPAVEEMPQVQPRTEPSEAARREAECRGARRSAPERRAAARRDPGTRALGACASSA